MGAEGGCRKVRIKRVPDRDALQAIAEQWRKKGLKVIPMGKNRIEGWRDGEHTHTAEVGK